MSNAEGQFEAGSLAASAVGLVDVPNVSKPQCLRLPHPCAAASEAALEVEEVVALVTVAEDLGVDVAALEEAEADVVALVVTAADSGAIAEEDLAATVAASVGVTVVGLVATVEAAVSGVDLEAATEASEAEAVVASEEAGTTSAAVEVEASGNVLGWSAMTD
jgi:hypothetical protein